MNVCLPVSFEERVALGAGERAAVEGLIAECRDADGFDPCMEFDTHLNADRDLAAWRLAWAGAARSRILAGAACAFAPSRAEGEISACVSPVFRRQGIFTRLYGGLADALSLSGAGSILVACDGASPSGAAVAARLGARLARAELLMRLPPERLATIRPPEGLRLVPVAAEGLGELASLSASAFGESRDDAAAFAQATLADHGREQFIARSADGAVGLAAIAVEGEGEGASAMLHGLGVVPGMRGRGLGGAIVDSCLVVLRKRGVRAISLEVDVTNAAALALYRSRGFREASRVDYYRAPGRGPVRGN
ncbi:MAG: GNAT family N-acetyltransferase [Spirochaetes bacterium]|nr:GNAT family N-acetyltransferase [Spirochaetota bacterium]